ncbi:uncharacterized protein LOC133173265 [Saccostrea echinata]|uniref:uncharacterized protein LOC133173265 n=1 Tax=Saccostrea echinata TaxID=191078 RepID=UPI002A80903E|nr:uncharacterized protein LOC133173265 [Saccostrea echinata]
MLYCTEFVILQSALQLVEKQEKKLACDKTKAKKPVCIVKLAVQEIVNGVEEDNEPKQKFWWSKRIHSVILYKVLASHYEKLPDEPTVYSVQEVNFKDGWIEPKKLDSQDVLSDILPFISKSLYFSLVKECSWHRFLTEILWHLRDDFSSQLISDGIGYLNQLDTHNICDLKLGACFIEHMVSYLISDSVKDNIQGALSLLSDVLTQCCIIIDNLKETPLENEDIIIITTCFYQISLLLCLCNKVESIQNLQKWFDGNAIATKSSTSEKSLSFQDYFCKFMKDNIHGCFFDLNDEVINYLRENLSLQCLFTSLIKLMSLGGPTLCCSLLDSLSSDSELRLVYICESEILMYSENQDQKSDLNKVKVKFDSRNLVRKINQLLPGTCDPNVKDDSETVCSYLSSMLDSVNIEDEMFPDISITAAVWRVQERQPRFQDFLLRFVTSPIASLWSCDKLLSVLQLKLDLLAEKELMLYLYKLVWKLNDKLAETQLEKLTKLVMDSFSQLDLPSRGQHIVHVYTTYKEWPKPQPVTHVSLNQILNKFTSAMEEKVLVEIHQAVLQNADLTVSQLLERAVGGTHQADIVYSILQTLQELCLSREDSDRSVLCCRLDAFLTSHSLTQKEQDTMIKFLQNLIKQGKEAVLDPEEFYFSVVVPHLSSHRRQDSELTVKLALDLGKIVLVEILEQGKSNIDLTLSLVSAAEILENCRALWYNTDNVNIKPRVVDFLNLLRQFKEKQTFCVDWIVQTTMDYDCTVRLATLHVCLTDEEFHSVCDTLCKHLLHPDQELDYRNFLRLVAEHEVLSQMIGGYLHDRWILNYPTLLLTLLQVTPHLISEECIRLYKFLRGMVRSGHLCVSVKMSGILPLLNLTEISELLPLSQLLCDVLRLLSQTHSQLPPPAVEHCIRSAMAVYKNVVLSETTTSPRCCMFLLNHVFSHITMAIGHFPPEMLDSVNILLLDIVCQVEDLCGKVAIDTMCRDQLTGLQKTSCAIPDTETRDMVQKKLCSVLHVH